MAQPSRTEPPAPSACPAGAEASDREPDRSQAFAGAPPLRSLIGLALYLGAAGFGGGFSVLAMIRRETVDRRRWLTIEPFTEMLEVSKVLPGTSATNLFTLLGQRWYGALGGAAAGVAFLFPSALLMLLLAVFYPELRRIADLGTFLDGLGIAMVPIVGAVVFQIGRDALRSVVDPFLAVFACGLMVFESVGLLDLALGAAAGGAALRFWQLRRTALPAEGGLPPTAPALLPLSAWKGLAIGLGIAALPSLAVVFARIGAATFGGGLVMIPAIQQQVVELRHWLTPAEFSDAIAFGQVTPGPVAISATFIGFRVAGLAGAIVATVAMFSPAMVLSLLVGRGLDRFRRNELVRGALRALGPAVIGMLLAAMVSLGQISLGSPLSLGITVVGLVALLVFELNPLWVLLGGGTSTLLAARFFAASF